jgi:acyl-CoA thioesterase
MTPHPFDLATELRATGEGEWLATTSDAYWNMVGPFGGWIAALIFKAAYGDDRRQGEPLSLTVNFCAAVRKGELRIAARSARTNRSTQHWTIEMTQDDECVATGTAMFGVRPETFAHNPLTMPRSKPFDELDRFPAPGSGWIERYDLRFAEGNVGWTGGGDEPGDPRSLLWIDSDPPRPLDFVGLTAMCDIFFGRIIHVRQRMVPFGTVTMTAYFHATEADLTAQGDSPLLGEANARTFDRGFHDQSAELWGKNGRLLATSHQLVYYRDPS